MSDIQHIYHNKIGMSFQWKKDLHNHKKELFQIIFRDTGFYVSLPQIETFSQLIQEAKTRNCCDHCKKNANCRSILLKTPAAFIDMAVSKKELTQISDLIEGTLFQIKLQKYVDGVCRN